MRGLGRYVFIVRPYLDDFGHVQGVLIAVIGFQFSQGCQPFADNQSCEWTDILGWREYWPWFPDAGEPDCPASAKKLKLSASAS